jgi:hypothetical protein
LRKCDFLSGKVRYWPDPDPKLFIPDPDPDPAKSSGSDRIRIHNTDLNTEDTSRYENRSAGMDYVDK